MKLQTVQRSIDRQLLTAMVTSTHYLHSVEEMYRPEFFSSSYMQIVAEWCFKYYRTYGEAPGRHIEQLYDRAVRKEDDRIYPAEELELVSKFLTGLSNEFEASQGLNVPFLVDETERWWRKQDLRQLIEEIDNLLESAADPKEAELLLRQHKNIERALAEGMDVFNEPEKLSVLFEMKGPPLIEFAGALGSIVNPWMTRDQLIGVLAPPKGGKTADLVEMCVRGVAARCNVALFETGDLSEQQTLARVYSNLTGRCTDDRYTGEHMVSVLDCLKNQTGECTKRCRTWTGAVRSGFEEPFPETHHHGYKPCTACQGHSDFQPCYGRTTMIFENSYTPEEVENTRRKMAAYMGNRRFRTHTTPNSTISVGGIDNVLKKWKEQFGFIPDVIVIDYADILAAEDSCKSGDERAKQNERWKALRRLSQEWHCLVIVATQTDGEGFGKEDLDFGNYSEDVRKYAHCTGMLAIHQTEYEKERGICRVSWILGREGQPARTVQAVVLQNLYIGRFVECSFMRDRTYRPKYKEEEYADEQDE